MTSRPAHGAEYTLENWRTAGALLLVYLLVELVSSVLFPFPYIRPEHAIAIAALFFAGIRFWPIIVVGSVAGALLTGNSLLVEPISAGLQGICGAMLLKHWDVDPIFRLDHDVFWFIATCCLVSFFAPFFHVAALLISGETYIAGTWIKILVANIFTLLVFTPFALRWYAKPAFSRTYQEILEICSAFGALIFISWLMFIQHVGSLFDIPLLYFLMFPLTVIALRLRPRFVTLGIVIVSSFALYGLRSPVSETALFNRELFLIALSAISFVITALEESRRANANRLRSQVATLENAVARISSESRAKNDFIAILAHELRNPLTPVVSGIEILKLKDRDTEDKSVLESMASGMKTVRGILNDLLDVSRISTGKIMLDKKVVTVESIIRSAIHSTEHHFKERHQYLDTTQPKKPFYIMADPVRLEQVFSNLLTNASKYSNAGDTVSLHVRSEKNHVIVSVRDTGVGIEARELKNIFLPFRQIDNGSRTKEGLGIGLSLVQDFIKMHGGEVHAESPGKGLGSTFTVKLPLLIRK